MVKFFKEENPNKNISKSKLNMLPEDAFNNILDFCFKFDASNNFYLLDEENKKLFININLLRKNFNKFTRMKNTRNYNIYNNLKNALFDKEIILFFEEMVGKTAEEIGEKIRRGVNSENIKKIQEIDEKTTPIKDRLVEIDWHVYLATFAYLSCPVWLPLVMMLTIVAIPMALVTPSLIVGVIMFFAFLITLGLADGFLKNILHIDFDLFNSFFSTGDNIGMGFIGTLISCFAASNIAVFGGGALIGAYSLKQFFNAAKKEMEDYRELTNENCLFEVEKDNLYKAQEELIKNGIKNLREILKSKFFFNKFLVEFDEKYKNSNKNICSLGNFSGNFFEKIEMTVKEEKRKRGYGF